MDSQDATSEVQHNGGSRPTLGFPLGTALLLLVIFFLSAVFSCCYHWEKIRRLCRPPHQTHRDNDPDGADLEDHNSIPSPPFKANSSHQKPKESGSGESLPVIMPGDRVAKFIACPCPCEPFPPLPPEKIIVEVQTLPPPPQHTHSEWPHPPLASTDQEQEACT